jgi:hypothetical protein
MTTSCNEKGKKKNHKKRKRKTEKKKKKKKEGLHKLSLEEKKEIEKNYIIFLNIIF